MTDGAHTSQEVIDYISANNDAPAGSIQVSVVSAIVGGTCS
jgi:hypothetical protein